MAKKFYQWNRYWRPRGSDLLLRDNGFLFSPGKYNSHVLPFEKIADTPCLVLLGEPGMGKSSEMQRLHDTLELSNSSDEKLICNLNEVTTDFGLVDLVFNAPQFQEWQSSNHNLHLFLDSLDEGRLRVATIADIIASRLARLSTSRRSQLFLRIACTACASTRRLKRILAPC